MQNGASSSGSGEKSPNQTVAVTNTEVTGDDKDLAVLISYLDGTAQPETLRDDAAELGKVTRLSHIYLIHTSN